MPPIIELRDFKKTYKTGEIEVHAVRGVNLTVQAGEFVACLQILVSLAQPIDHFFADVMVMDPRPELRDNRLALLQQLHQKMNLIADLGKLA